MEEFIETEHLQETLEDIVDRYDLPTMSETLAGVMARPRATIGFVGRYSSGKSSLINMLYGCKLPVATKPTTRAICLIEKSAAVDRETYYVDVGRERAEVDVLEFYKIINGDVAGDAALVLPETAQLPEGVTIVDTPGIDSMAAEDKERTYSYLQNLDATIVCIPVIDGTLQGHIENFIQDPRFVNVQDRMLFVITMCDCKKSADAVKHVRDEIVNQLERLVSDGKLKIACAAERVVTVSKDSQPDELKKKIEDVILSKQGEMVAHRQRVELISLAGEIRDALVQRKKMLTYNSDDIEKAMDQQKALRSQLEKRIEEKRSSLEELESKLAARLADCLLGYKERVSSTHSGDDVSEVLKDLEQSLKCEVDSFAVRYVSDFAVSSDAFGGFNTMVKDRMAGIQQTRDTCVGLADVVAAIAISIATAGGGAAAAGGAAAKQTGKAAAKTAAKTVAKETAKKTAKKTAEKVAEKGFFARIMPGVGKALKTVDPFEWIGDLAATRSKATSYENLVRGHAQLMASRVVGEMAQPYDEQVVQPIRRGIDEAERALLALREDRKKGIEDFRRQARQLDEDIGSLSAICA